MPSKSRGGLSQREYDKKMGKSSPVLSGTQAKSAASVKVKKDDGVSKSLAKAQKDYIASLTPTGEENSALSSLNTVNQQAEVERAKIVDPTKNTVALPFVQNQTSALADKTENAVIPLKYQIAALQSQRQARGDVAQAKIGFAKSSKVAATNPLDEEYKQLRNENLKKTIAKKGKSGSGDTQSLAKSNAEYNRRKQDDSQRGLVTLPKGVSGPPAPKVLIPKKTKGRSA